MPVLLLGERGGPRSDEEESERETRTKREEKILILKNVLFLVFHAENSERARNIDMTSRTRQPPDGDSNKQVQGHQRENRKSKKEQERRIRKTLGRSKDQDDQDDQKQHNTMPWGIVIVVWGNEGEGEGEASDPHNNQNTLGNGGKKEL